MATVTMNELKPAEANVSGEASVIRAADRLQAQPATLRATVHVTRAGTGLVETFEIVGTTASQKDEVDASPSGTPDAQRPDR